MNYRITHTLLISLFFTGCTFVGTPVIETESEINPSAAYIYGNFSVHNEIDTISTLNLVQSPKIVYLIESTKDQEPNGHIILSKENTIKAIPLKPGKYAFGHILYTAKGQIKSNKSILKDNIRVIENLEANKAYYIGDYTGNTKTERTGGGTIYSWNLSKPNNNFTSTTREFSDKFIKFKNIHKIDFTKKLKITNNTN